VKRSGRAATIAVIGTAGRGADAGRVTADLWPLMERDCALRIAELAPALSAPPGSLRLVTGGAPWADHLAVRLWRAGAGAGLRLCLPAAPTDRGFDPEDPVGASMNAAHAAFEAATGVPGLAELRAARQAGAALSVHPGRSARNAAVAGDADAVLAYTFATSPAPLRCRPGAPGFDDPLAAGLGEPSTAETWRLAQRARIKWHVPLQALLGTRR
jgi:hypothetical protein